MSIETPLTTVHEAAQSVRAQWTVMVEITRVRALYRLSMRVSDVEGGGRKGPRERRKPLASG